MQINTIRDQKYLPVLAGIFCAVLVLIPSLSSKFVTIFGLTVVGSTLIFPVVFILNDVFTEVYGFSRTRIIIWTGMLMQIVAAFLYWLVEVLPAPDFWANQDAYQTILGQSFRIVLASLTAYFFGEFVNSLVVSKLKYKQGGKRGSKQAVRFVASTIVGEGLDSLLFMTIAFLGTMPTSELFKIVVTIWAVKVAYEVVMLPVSMKIANFIKTAEGLDKIDTPNDTNYNPFKFKT
jgi:queuosine precursor transporter